MWILISWPLRSQLMRIYIVSKQDSSAKDKQLMNIMNALLVKNEYVHRNDLLQCANICLAAACILCQLPLIDIFVIRTLQVNASCMLSENDFLLILFREDGPITHFVVFIFVMFA